MPKCEPIFTGALSNWPTHWCKIVPPKINFFLWRARLNKLHDKCNLLERGIELDNLFCPSCSNQVEDLTHICFECNIAVQVWVFIASWLDIVLPVWQSVDAIWQWIMTKFQSHEKSIILEAISYATLRTLGRFRNGSIFDPSKFKKCHIIDSIVLYSFDWLSSRYRKANINWNVWLCTPLLSL
ncbi:uncharacterized protein [Rutidosis leptorrhynchoides]|uniref:uncharacterized protein n=1 Tax=Rutidosis leptorrhynchoides TaxID=125765 RepID=UPI003A998514